MLSSGLTVNSKRLSLVRSPTPEELRARKNVRENAWLWFYGMGAFAMNQLLKIAGFVVGRFGLPTLPEDADPLKGQRANDGCMFFALFEHVFVVNGQVSGDRRRVGNEDLECQGMGVTGYSWRGRVSKRRFGSE